MSDIRTEMPMLARSEGIWDGWYRYYDASGIKIDEHRSRLVCRLPDHGPYPYHQTNFYTWENGKQETRDFPASYANGRIWFDNELIKGWAAAVPLDEFNRTMMLYWKRKNEPNTYLYEMIQVDDDCKKRSRVWQWITAGEITMRTLIDEHKVSDTYEGY